MCNNGVTQAVSRSVAVVTHFLPLWFPCILDFLKKSDYTYQEILNVINTASYRLEEVSKGQRNLPIKLSKFEQEKVVEALDRFYTAWNKLGAL